MSDLKLSKEIFDLRSIEKAMGDYLNLTSISMGESDFYFEFTFSHCIYDKNITMAEFENYVIDIMNTKAW